jgi:hypothetical protein
MIAWVALVLVWSAPEGGYPKEPVGVATSVCPSNVTIHPDTCITGLGCELNICMFAIDLHAVCSAAHPSSDTTPPE